MRGLLCAAALSLAAVVPASAQMMGDPMMAPSGQSCVMNGQFVPCPPGGGMRGDGMAPNPMAVPGMAVGAAAGAVGGAVAGVGAGMAAGAEAMDPRMNRRMTARERREQQRMMRRQQQQDEM